MVIVKSVAKETKQARTSDTAERVVFFNVEESCVRRTRYGIDWVFVDWQEILFGRM